MQKINDHKSSNLWLGFFFGAAATATLGFFLGTKKGRETLKKLLEVSENLEENVLILGEELEEMVMEKVSPQAENQGNTGKKDKPSLGNLLDKMKILKST